ncbi:MAG: FecR domain-containing protein [Prolixibacteraceae bacterium]|jgi:ferric-dicitrate binding protein FerR (iron transport regulator)
MKEHFDYDELLASHFSGTLTEAEEKELQGWKGASEENRMVFKNAEKVWQSLNMLQEMRGYDVAKALSNVHRKTEQTSGYHPKGFFFYWQRIAAILLLPLLISGTIYYIQAKHTSNNSVVWQTIVTPPGVKTHVQLPDGTFVWLNSGSSLQYPSSFSDGTRNVKLQGEAFFEVAKDKKHPFDVDLGKINIEVIGTAFNVINYRQEGQTEVVLTSGKVKLFEKHENKSRLISEMEPGQQAIYLKAQNAISLKKVDTGKHTSWIDGKLIFRDDPMTEVVRKLDRWFNVQIEMADPEIAGYIYTATFQNETIEQILNLITRTSPVEYSVLQGKRLKDGSFEKQRIIVRKKLK